MTHLSDVILLDGEGEFKKCNRQLHKRVGECVRALNVMEELNLGTCAPADKVKTIRILFNPSSFSDRKEAR